MDSKKTGSCGGQRCLALLLAAVLIFCTVAFAAEDGTEETSAFGQVTTTTLQSMGNSGFTQMTITSYLTSQGTTEKTVKPCDIIFVLDQSRWMNGTNGTERAAILDAMEQILDDLETPTTGGEHRVAIAGYGRVNVNQMLDSYNAAEYPGVQHTGSAISLNTGYYTAAGFRSQNGWTEVKDSSSAELPTMPSAFQTAMTYDSAFMSVDQAKAVIDPDTMLAWYSGASRMDAGLTMAEQLAVLANAQDENNERNLIVCVVASSIPIQNYLNKNWIRDDAVLAAADNLKAQGATIFALGDYHNAGKNLAADTEAHFNEVMTSVCGNSDTPDAEKSDYFFSMSKYGSATAALNQMITQVTVTVAGSARQNVTVTADSVVDGNGDPVEEETWKNWLQSIPGDTLVDVKYCKYYGSAYGYEFFDEYEPYMEQKVPLSDLLVDGTIQYEAKLIPLKPDKEWDFDSEASLEDGDEVVITFTNPLTVSYLWVGEAPDGVDPPEAQYVPRGDIVWAPEVSVEDSHYGFEGWFTDEACSNSYFGNATMLFDMTLYGKWTKYALVNFHTQVSDLEDVTEWVKVGETVNDRALTRDGYTFGGWYTDQDCTTAYDFTQPVTEDMDLYAKWTANNYQVQFDANAENAAGAMENQTFAYDVPQNLTKNAFQLEGYTFAGWNTKSDGSGENYADEQSVCNLTQEQGGIVTLYAQWTIHTYTITVEVTNGTADVDATVTVNHGDSQTITFAANEGYALDSVTVDGEAAALEDGAYIFNNVSANHSIQVVYSPDTNSDGIPDKDQVFVKFQSGDPDMGSVAGDTQVFAAGQPVTPTLNNVTVTPANGYAFGFWTMDDGSDSVDPTETLENIPGGTTIVFYAQWTAAYQVERYLEQLDGTYKLAETEYPLYGEIGETVAAAEKSYGHYHVNTEKSTNSGAIFAPTLDENNALSLLTLQIYYDLDTVTVTYDLNGGEGGDTDYSQEMVKYGTTVTLKTEPIRPGYAFTGWQIGDSTYEPGDTLEILTDTTVVAQWLFNLIPPTGVGTDLVPWAVLLLAGLGGCLGMGVHKIRKRRKYGKM
jgi:uncharacterized repeat protein (TIGR02543 family)